MTDLLANDDISQEVDMVYWIADDGSRGVSQRTWVTGPDGDRLLIVDDVPRGASETPINEWYDQFNLLQSEIDAQIVAESKNRLAAIEQSRKSALEKLRNLGLDESDLVALGLMNVS